MASSQDENGTGKSYPLPIYYENDGLLSSDSVQRGRGRGRGRGRPPIANRGRSRGRRGGNSSDYSSQNNVQDESDETGGTRGRSRGHHSQRGRGRGGRRGGTSVDRRSRHTDELKDETETVNSRGRRPASCDSRQKSENFDRDVHDSGRVGIQSAANQGIKRPPVFTEGNLVRLSKKDDPDEILLDIGHSRSGFVEFIRKTPDPKMIFYLIRLLCKVSESTKLAIRREILQEVEKSFLHNLTELLNNVSMKDKSTSSVWDSDSNLARLLINISKLIGGVITTLPSSLAKCKAVITAIKEVKDEHNVHCIEDALREVQDIFKREKEAKQKSDDANETGKLRKMKPGSTIPGFEEMGQPPDSFRDISIFPTLKDLQVDEKPFLRANKAKGKYEDLDTYLDVQFRLLREDYVQPLRKGVTEYRAGVKEGIQVKKLRDIRLYHYVQILRPVCSSRGINYILQFDTTHFKRMNWVTSRRLLYGSLVCLSKDNFETVFYATVTERDAKDLNDGFIQVYFENKDDMLEILPNDVFIMAETTAYFEAFRYVLEGLQEMDDKMPLQCYIINCETVLKAPKYLLHSEDPKYDFTCLLTGKTKDSNCLVLSTPLWPAPSELELDSFQYEAIQTAITKELAIIQGPPGTGKTHVGLKITQLLLNNKGYWKNRQECPILVVCYTNHALDQFLEGLTKFSDGKIVRIGGRCKSDVLEPFILRNIKKSRKEKKQRSFRVMQNERDCRSQLRDNERKIEEISIQLKKTSTKVVSYTKLSHFMSDHQRDVFEGGVQEDSFNSCISNWLGIVSKQSGEDDMQTDGEKFMNVWKLSILENVVELPSHKRDLIYDAWDLDLYTRAEMYKSWISEMTENIRNKLDKANDRTGYLETLLHRVKESIVDVYTLLKHVSKYVTCFQVQSLFAGKICTTDTIIADWLELTGRENAIPFIRFSLEIIADNYGDDKKSHRIESVDEEDDLEEERQLDEDDEFMYDFDHTKRNKYHIPTDGDWLVKFDERKMAHKVKSLLNSAKKLTSEKAESFGDVFRLQKNQRRDLYNYWIQMYRQQLKDDVKTYEEGFNKATEKLEEVRDMETLEILKEADIMGMTTTGAAKYRKLLQTVLPKIIIVEEAAEVLESHIVTTLNVKCQHLILIGDHKQLRPSTTVYELSKKYSMDVSLFERMVRNDVPCVTLQEQHRMRPDISTLLKHKRLYPQLRDHESVLKYESIKGVDENVQFIDHDETEVTQDESTSYSNPHEAKFIAAMCMYFLNQGYAPAQITVITPYMGQVLLLRREMPKTTFEGVRITAVDNFQGEENDIILLSLVRSSSYERKRIGRNMIGFVGIENRICVSLSRAKKGLYVFGNFKLMEDNSSMWADMVYDMRVKGLVKRTVTLRCQNHPQHTVYAEKASDFAKVPNGGCKKPCDGKLPCGHRCPKSCHVIDNDHKKATCVVPCNKIVCKQGHKCTQKCYQKCGRCNTFVEKKIPTCDHIERMPCHIDPLKWKCQMPCDFLLSCGHLCNKKCHDCVSTNKHEQVCQVEVLKKLPCKHTAKMKCFESTSSYICKLPCNDLLNCKHTCSGTCGFCYFGRIHKGCKGTCKKRLPCGHECTFPCSDFCPPCPKPCGWVCSHGKHCKKKCWEECEPCREQCSYKCKHKKCDKDCYEECEEGPCEEQCMWKLNCGHVCRGICSETCICVICQSDNLRNEIGETFDRSSCFIQLPNCKCIFEVRRLGLSLERETSYRHGDLCKHCPYCSKPITKDLKHFSNILKRSRAKIAVRFEFLIGSVNERKLKIAKIKQQFQSLKIHGLTDTELKRLFNQLENQNNFGALHIATRRVDRLKLFLPLYNDIKNVESSGISFSTKEEVESIVNPEYLREVLLEGRKVTTKQFWDEVDMEIKRLRLVLELFLSREFFVNKHTDDHKLKELFQRVFDVLSRKTLSVEMIQVLQSTQEAFQNFRRKDKVDTNLISKLSIRMLFSMQPETVDRLETTVDMFNAQSFNVKADMARGRTTTVEELLYPAKSDVQTKKRRADDFLVTSLHNVSETSNRPRTTGIARERFRETTTTVTPSTRGSERDTRRPVNVSSEIDVSLGSDSFEPVSVKSQQTVQDNASA